MIVERGMDGDYLLYHELMHAKEVLDGRFPSSGLLHGPEDFVGTIIGRLCDFANEGKLEAMGKPHLSKETTIENIFNCFAEDAQFGIIPQDKIGLLTKEAVKKLCDKTWGTDLTYYEAERIVNELLR